MINKRFPADTHIAEDITFLHDKKINGELYSFLQSISTVKEGSTQIMKSNLPIQKEICQKIGVKDPKTYRVHLRYLIETGYIVDNVDKYILPDKEDIYLLIPIDTLKFIYDTLREPVIKTYIYLGQRFKYKKDYLFTKTEIAEHLGLNDKRAYEKIDNYLKVLSHCGLIEFECVRDKKMPKMKLLNWSTRARR